MAFTSINEYLNRRGVVYRVRVEVLLDDAVTWLDLTDRINQDRLAGLPGLARKQTRSVGAAEVSLSTLSMDNSDRFWDKAKPAGISTWLRHKVRVSIVAPPAPKVLGVFLVDDVETAGDSDVASVTLKTLSARLIDKQADRVKNGRDWYTNRSIGWLVRQLLLQEFTLAEVQSWAGVLSTYQIPLSDPTQRALSTFGRPPEFDGTLWRSDGTTLYGDAYAVVNTIGSAHYGEHWVGVGSNLWRYMPDTDTWTLWGTMPAPRAAFRIMHVYVNATRNKVIVVAWKPDVPPATYPTTTGHRSGADSGDVAVLYADMGATGPPLGAPVTLTEYASGKPANIYTGHYVLRAGATGGGYVRAGAPAITIGVSPADADCAGVNCPVPFGHWQRVRFTNPGIPLTPPYPPQVYKKDGYNTKSDLADQGDATKSGVAWAVDIVGYAAPADPTGTYPMDYRWSLGQFRGAFALQNAGDEFVCAVVAWDGANNRYTYRLWKLNTNTGVWTDTTEYMGASSGGGTMEHLAPLSMVFRADDAKLLCTALRFRETAWSAGAPVIAPNEPYSSAVIEFSYPLVDTAAPVGMATQTLLYLNTQFSSVSNPERYWVALYDAIYGSSNDYVLLTGIDVRGVLTGGAYVAFEWRISTSAGGNPLYSSGRLSGAVCDPTVGKFYLHDAGSNQLQSQVSGAFTSGTGGNMWQIEDGGLPPVSGDPGLLYGIVLDVKRSALYGVSGPGAGWQANAEILGDAPLTGKYYLWQFASWLTDRVELADFSDNGANGETALNLWDALEQLSAMIDGVFGFDTAGAFYFKPRPTAGAIVATLAANSREEWTASTKRVPDVVFKKRTGAKNVFNMVEITPSIAVLQPPGGSVRTLARPANWAPTRPQWNASPDVFQGNNRNLSLMLRCAKGGLPGSEDDGCVRKTVGGLTMVDFAPGAGQRLHRLRFAYLMYDTVVETQILSASLATSHPSTFVIPYDAGTGIRSLDPSASFVVQNFPTADTITIGDTETYQIRTVTLNAAAGTASLLVDPDAISTWPVGTKVTIRTFGNARWSDNRVGITSNASSAGGSGSVGGTSTFDFFSTREMCPGMVLGILDTVYEEVRVLQVLNATQALVRRGINGTTPTWHVTVAPVIAYWAPAVTPDFADGTRFGIGGSGVSLRFSQLPDSGDNPFMVGDEIDVTCPGLKLEAQDKAKIISYNAGSIQKLQGSKIPWPSVRNSRFMGYRQAIEIARRITASYGNPHFDLTAELPMRWLPDLNETYLAEDLEGTLPQQGSNTSPNGDAGGVAPDTVTAIAVMVEGVTIDPINDKVSLDLRAVNPHL